MRDRESTIRSRELGDGLRVAMARAKLTGQDAARELGWSPSRVSRLLSGKRGGKDLDVSAFLAICGVKGRERQRLLRLCQEMDKAGWLQQHGSRLPKQLRTLIDHEDKAVSIGDFQATLVPGLLQTGEYARALIHGTGNVPDSEIDDRVAARLARQQLFSREHRAQFTYFIHEFALRLPIGGPEVMSEQLHHLLRMSVRPYLTLRVAPTSLGAHAGIAGQFKLMEFAEFKPVVYIDSETSSLFLEEPEEIAAYRRILAGLADSALDEGQSRELIARLATELYAEGEGDDERT
ncbi:MAG: helix-turn-helix domain-containing protein [Sciscionella sp.]